MTVHKFEIPVRNEIRSFKRHISANERTILSAKFGDGKSYFLKKIRSDKSLARQYEFLTIYPVNYQVADNKDIFELLKRDVLLQLILHQMIDDSVKLEERDILSWFVYHKGGNVVTDILTSLPSLGFDEYLSDDVTAAMAGLKLFNGIIKLAASVKDKYKEFKIGIRNDDDLADDFLSKQEDSFLYEKDCITKIIQDSITSFRTQKKKKVALIVEDLDRIDPAHLFRVLNVLSAHMDYGLRDHAVPDKSLAGNKFGLDNIIIVVDYNNLKSIFRHFYGEHTDFSGYISKFLSSVPFEYSLERLKYDHTVDKISAVSGIDDNITRAILSPNEISSTLREVVQSFEIGKPDLYKLTVDVNGETVLLDNRIFKLMSVLKRMKYGKEEIIQKVLSIKEVDHDYYVKYVMSLAFLIKKEGWSADDMRIIVEKGDGGDLLRLIIHLNRQQGIAHVAQSNYVGPREKVTDMKEFLDPLYERLP